MKALITIILTLCLLSSACRKDTADNKSLSEIPNNDNELVDNQYQHTEIPAIEGYPQSRVEAIEAELESLMEVREKVDDLTYRSFISAQKTWNAGDVITVAFNGGTFELRQKIETAVKSWSDVANIKFDFRNPSQPSTYREWTISDTTYSAFIRIAFDSNNRSGSYWSAIGKESIKDYCDANSIAKSCYFPNEASMNFGGFVERLPADWQATVLHEFGHALGFLHEHQSFSSSCEQEFRWENEQGYVETTNIYGEFTPDHQNPSRNPGIYKVLGGPLNFWNTKQIDFNLKKFSGSGDLHFSTFDRNSIMKYYFDKWMYKDIAVSTNSGCYTPNKNTTLSPQDKIAAAETYPRSFADIQRVTNQRVKVSDKVLKLKNLSVKLKEEIKENIKAIKNQK